MTASDRSGRPDYVSRFYVTPPTVARMVDKPSRIAPSVVRVRREDRSYQLTANGRTCYAFGTRAQSSGTPSPTGKVPAEEAAWLRQHDRHCDDDCRACRNARPHQHADCERRLAKLYK